jgi:hypothetical protein
MSVVGSVLFITMPKREPERMPAFRAAKMRDLEARIGTVDLDEFAIDTARTTTRNENIHCRTESLRTIGRAYELQTDRVSNVIPQRENVADRWHCQPSSG